MTEYFIKKILTEELFGSRLCESVQQQEKLNFFYKHLMLEALVGEPLTIPELRNLLKQKIVDFEFIKLNGEIRPARGTTNLKFVPPGDHPKGTGSSSPTVATFFDLKKQLWRSVSQRSKEIVLKQEEPGKRPIVTVTDKDKTLVNKLDRFKPGRTYAYINRYGETGHTVTVMEVVEKGYYLKLDKTGPLFYLTIDTANKRIKNEITKPSPTTPASPPPTNRAVAKVQDLINEPIKPLVSEKPLDIKNNNKRAYDVKDDEIVVPNNILEPQLVVPSEHKPNEIPSEDKNLIRLPYIDKKEDEKDIEVGDEDDELR